MNTYEFSSTTRDWLSQLIGDHFDGRPVAVVGFDRPTKPNQHLHLSLNNSSSLPVCTGARQVQLVVNPNSRLVAFRPADSKFGILAAIFDSDGSQYTFIGYKNRLVYWSADYLNGYRRDLPAVA